MNNQGWGLNELLVGCGIIGMALIVSSFLISRNFQKLGLEMKNDSPSVTYTYKELEEKLEKECKKYIDKQHLTLETGSTMKIEWDTLKENGFSEKRVDQNGNECMGYVVFSKNADEEYHAYITCGDDYQTYGYKN